MKNLMLIVGIVCLAACLLSLLFAVFSRFGYYHLLDGSSDLYASLHRRMIVGFAAAGVLAVIGAVCLVIYAKN